MAVLITMVAAFATIVAIGKWQGQSATALGKVSAVVNVATVVAEAWSKTHAIAKRMADNPTLVALPQVSSPAPSTSLVRREPDPEDDFLSENPSFLTGGLRGYNAYARRP